MLKITANELLLVIIFTLYALGVLSTLSGILILISRAFGKDVKTIANQTNRLAQKGLAEDVAGLVGNASSLLEAMSQLVRETAGIGVSLVFFGILLITIAGILTLQIYPG